VLTRIRNGETVPRLENLSILESQWRSEGYWVWGHPDFSRDGSISLLTHTFSPGEPYKKSDLLLVADNKKERLIIFSTYHTIQIVYLTPITERRY
jgi:hypothetical protein